MAKTNIRLKKITKGAVVLTASVIMIGNTAFAAEGSSNIDGGNINVLNSYSVQEIYGGTDSFDAAAVMSNETLESMIADSLSPVTTEVGSTIVQVEEKEAEAEEIAREKKAAKKAKAEAAKAKKELGQKVAAYACKYVGVLPYVWAGASLEYGADCSGFTMAVYEKFGYTLSHDSEVQSQQGTSVALEDALPGDIVVYSGHVAMYIGDGQIVHSPQEGEYVKISDVDYMPVLDVRRIIQ